MSRQKGFIHSERTKRKIKSSLRKFYKRPPFEELYDLYWNQGLRQEDIAQRFNRSRTTVIQWMKDYGIKRRYHQFDPDCAVTCDCGCGETLFKFDGRGRPRRFIAGHQCRVILPSLRPESRRKISESKKGDKNPMRRIEVRERSSLSHNGKPLSDRHKIALAKAHSTPEYKAKHKEIMQALWQQPDFVKKQMLSRGVHPNKKERQIEELASQYGLPLHYVGDGQLIIGGKCPDFHNGNGKVVELFGDYWHRNENPSAKIDYYEKLGYKCLVIWEHELIDVSCVVSKLKEFLHDDI